MSRNSVRNKNQKNKRFGKIVFIIMTILSPFIGIFAGIYGIDQIENYKNPYFFAIICILIGIASGYYFSIWIKKFINLDKKQKSNYSYFTMYHIFGFIGIMLTIGSILNSSLSKRISCENYCVITKKYREYRFRDPGANYLVVKIDGKIEYLNCKFDYWSDVLTGMEINICIYESILGFDYFVLKDE